MKTAVPLPIDEIGAVCRRHGVSELAVFGSVLREDFRPSSDVDFLATFRNSDTGPWGGKVLAVGEELTALLGRPVDVLEKASVLQSENYIRKSHILKTLRTLYVEG